MTSTLLITTCPALRPVAASVLGSAWPAGGAELGQEAAGGATTAGRARWFALEFGDGQSVNEPPSEAAGHRFAAQVLSVVPELRLLTAEVPLEELRRVTAMVADQLRAAIVAMGRARSGLSERESDQLAHVVILTRAQEHDSNLLGLYALAGAQEAHADLEGQPHVRIDLVALTPSAAEAPDAQAAALALLETLGVAEPAEASDRPLRAVTLTEDELDAASSARPGALLEAGVTHLVRQVATVDRQQLQTGLLNQHFRLGSFGRSCCGYLVSDLLRLLAEHGGPDYRARFLLAPAVPDQDENLVELKAAFKQQLSGRVAKLVDSPHPTGLSLPSDPSVQAPSSGDLKQALGNQLNALAERIPVLSAACEDPPESDPNACTALTRSDLDKFGVRLAEHFEQLIDQHGLSLPQVGFVNGAWSDLARARDERFLELSRGDLVAPIDELVRDPTLKHLFEHNGDLSGVTEQIAASQDPAVRIRMGIMQRSPDRYRDLPELLSWMQAELQRMPEEIKRETSELATPVQTLEGELQQARQGTPRKLLPRKVDHHQVQRLAAELAQARERWDTTVSGLLQAYAAQIRQCAARSEQLGRWRVVRARADQELALLELPEAKVRERFEQLYSGSEVRGDDDCLRIAERLLGTKQCSPERLRLQADELANSAVLAGDQLRKLAEPLVSAPPVEELLPEQVADALPWNLQEALLDVEVNQQGDPVLVEVVRDQVRIAMKQCGFDRTKTPDEGPCFLPFFSMDLAESHEKRVAGLLRRCLTPPAPDLPSRVGDWCRLPLRRADRAEVTLVCLGGPLGQFERHASMIAMTQRYRDRQRATGQAAIPFSEIYRALVAAGERAAATTSQTGQS
jgi:hypothetical protein